MSAPVEGQDDLLYEVRDGIAYVTFNRPQARNALTFAMYDRLTEICEAVDRDRTIRGMLLTGAGGKAFASGTDISQFRAFDSREDALAYEERIDRVLGALERCRVPTLAAIAGACTGGGAALAGCCDLRIAASDARFGFPVARTLGNCLSMSNYGRFAALIGPARVKDLVFRARLIDAAEAKAIGLVSEVVEDPSALMPAAETMIRTVAAHAPLTLQATKEALLRLRPTLAPGAGEDLLLMCYLSRDFREGMDAFLSKRRPEWTGS
jgi:enoyl-CoA hydratase